jgi:hypothetical protein
LPHCATYKTQNYGALSHPPTSNEAKLPRERFSPSTHCRRSQASAFGVFGNAKNRLFA